MKSVCVVMVTISLFLLLGLGGIIGNSQVSPEIILRFFIVLGVFVVFSIGLIVLEKRTTRPGKCAHQNNQYKYTPSPLDYASSFYLGQPVVTTEEYGDGPGYHCYIDNIDRTCIGRPFRIKLLGSESFDDVSFDEIIPDVDFENIDMEVAQ